MHSIIACQLTVNLLEEGLHVFQHLNKSRDYAFLSNALLVPVQSSNISHVAFYHDPDQLNKIIPEGGLTGNLYVLFKPGKKTNGALYQYLGVPERMYLHLLNADSKVKYLNAVIKDRFVHKKIEEDQIEVLTEGGAVDA